LATQEAAYLTPGVFDAQKDAVRACKTDGYQVRRRNDVLGADHWHKKNADKTQLWRVLVQSYNFFALWRKCVGPIRCNYGV
jgi:hypothetical protein